MSTPHTAQERYALVALGAIVVVTVGWWAAALWPLPAATPEWVLRARAACFGTERSGLPNGGGWILLIGTPLSMLAALAAIAPRELRGGIRWLRSSRSGRGLLVGSALGLVLLAGAAGARVAAAAGVTVGNDAPADFAGEPRRVSRATPALGLVNQSGATVRLEEFRGRPVIVTFAYGKCETVCPVVVHSVLAARDALTGDDPVVLIVTLDPWRDTVQRLPQIAESWELPSEALVLGGTVERVETVLDAWGIERSRDLRTGEIAHPSIAYVVDREGRIAFVTSGNADQITAAVRRL
ncbi:MAG: SCO family protein [Gemmatimonadota bacterium]